MSNVGKAKGRKWFSHQNPLGTEAGRGSVLLYGPLSAMAGKEPGVSVFIMRDNYGHTQLKRGQESASNHVSR